MATVYARRGVLSKHDLLEADMALRGAARFTRYGAKDESPANRAEKCVDTLYVMW